MLFSFCLYDIYEKYNVPIYRSENGTGKSFIQDESAMIAANIIIIVMIKHICYSFAFQGIVSDEPMGNSDSKFGTKIMELFSKINRGKGITIVHVTRSE